MRTDQHGAFDDAGDEQHMSEDGCAGGVVARRTRVSMQRSRAAYHQQQMREHDLPERLLPSRRHRRQREKRP